MSPRSAGALPLLITLKPQAAQPLNQQIYEAARALILEGRVLAGTRLPSSRVLAADLGVSRNTVVNAFERLTAEGYIEGRAGGGTRVSSTLPDDLVRPRIATVRQSTAPPLRRSSHRAEALRTIRIRTWSGRLGDVRPFRMGVGALSEFPMKVWGRLARRRWARSRAAAIDYDELAGYAPLRKAIAAYLQSARGVACDPSHVIIVNGSQQALDLASRLLIDPGDTAWFEEPGYDGARGALLGAGARIAPVAVDRDGLNVSIGVRDHGEARLAYVTPSHQFPLGVTMSLARRLELLRWASRSGAWIFEDDYDSEFRYSQRPLPALQGLDTDACVIYAGSFSKILFPALRLGYLVVPPSLLETFLRARFLADVHPSTITQAILADFIADGHFERHIRRMRLLYRERQEALVSAARVDLAGLLQVQPAGGGMHLVGWLPADVDDRAAARAAKAGGVVATPLSFFAQARHRRGALLLGYAGLTLEQIANGTKRLAKALEPLCRRRGRRASRRTGTHA